MEHDAASRRCRPYRRCLTKAAGCDRRPQGSRTGILPSLDRVHHHSLIWYWFAEHYLPSGAIRACIDVQKEAFCHMCELHVPRDINHGRDDDDADAFVSARFPFWYRSRRSVWSLLSWADSIPQTVHRYAKAKRQKLWIVFVDFKQVNDRVPRFKLLQETGDIATELTTIWCMSIWLACVGGKSLIFYCIGG